MLSKTPVPSTASGPARPPVYAAPARIDTQEPTAAIWAAALTVFMIYSRALETFALIAGFRIPYLLSALLVLVFLASLNHRRLFDVLAQNKSLRYFLLFTGWMLVCAPLSYWRGGTAKLLLLNWFPLIVGLIGIGAMIQRPRPIRRIAGLMALSAMSISFFGLVFGRFDADDRLRIAIGSLGNSNDLALLILSGLPFLFLLLFDGSWGWFSKIVSLLTIPVAVIVILRTGSRAALLALIITFVLLLAFSYGANRVKLLIIGIVVVLLGSVSLSDRLVNRLGTLFSDDETIVEAAESRKHRREKLQESIEMTLQNPLFGVGPGVHDAAQAEVDMESGLRPDWQVSHNSFTQVSSETGIPGFLLYVAATLGPLWRLWRARSALFKVSSLKPYRNLVSVFLMSGLSLVVTNLFGSNAYLFYMPLMMVMIDNVALMVRELIAESRATVQGNVPIHAVAAPSIPRPPSGPAARGLGPFYARPTR